LLLVHQIEVDQWQSLQMHLQNWGNVFNFYWIC
jgi:hypothetical protein